MTIGTQTAGDCTSASATPTQLTATPTQSVITITAHHHIPVKLTASTYLPWRANFLAVLNGFDLTGHIDGRRPSPPVTDPAYPQWFRQDQLILAAIFGSVAVDILPVISSATTAAGAWNILARLYSELHMKAKEDELNSVIMELRKNMEALQEKLVKEEAGKLEALDSLGREREARLAAERLQASLSKDLKLLERKIQYLEKSSKGLHVYNMSLLQYICKLESDVDAVNEELKRVKKEDALVFENLIKLIGDTMLLFKISLLHHA